VTVSGADDVTFFSDRRLVGLFEDSVLVDRVENRCWSNGGLRAKEADGSLRGLQAEAQRDDDDREEP